MLTISKRAAWVLIALCAWTLYVWISRIVIMAGQSGNSAGFVVVHTILAVISIAFGVAAGSIGYRALRRGSARPNLEHEREPVLGG
jgi:hypothetical protein